MIDAEIGLMVSDFVDSDMGKFIVKRAETHRRKVLVDFAKADITNLSEMQRLQNAINITDLIVAWFGEAIAEGRACSWAIEKEKVLSDSHEDIPKT